MNQMDMNENSTSRTPIGKTSSPERQPNSTSKFYCWLKEGVVVNPFDFLVVEHIKDTKSIGIVSEMTSPSDALSHLANYVSSGFGEPLEEPYVSRLKSTVAEITVLRNTGYVEADGREVEVSMPLPSDRLVYFADSTDIQKAIGVDRIKGESIPAGIIVQSNGLTVPVSLDSDYLLGPEGAHINASGISGLATKTSYLMFLLMAIYQRMQDKVAIIIFNVKQADLLHIHEGAEQETLTRRDEEIYKLLGLRTEPLQNVKYFLPRGPGGTEPDSDDPPSEFSLYAYELADVHSRFDLLFADVPDPYFTLDTFNSRVREDWANGRLVIGTRTPVRRGAGVATVVNWTDMRNVDNQLLVEAYNLHPTTPPRIKRELTRLTSSPLFVNNRGKNEIYLGKEVKRISPGDIFVIDINRVPTRTQPFVVGDVMRSIDELYRYEEPASIPTKLIVLIDELNSFAPSGSTSAITEQIVEIARKGRSRGTILFCAQQFKSEVHDQITGNCGTHAIGRTGAAEVRKRAYTFLDEKSKQNIMGLGQGDIVLSTPTWRSPIKIAFPKPAYRKIERR